MLYDMVKVEPGPLADYLIMNGLIAQCDDGHWHMTKPRTEWKFAVDALLGKPKVSTIKGAGRRR